MRVAALLLLVIAVVLPVRAQDQGGGSVIRPVSVAELEQGLAHANVVNESDPQLAKELSTMELTERLSESRWERSDAQLPGSESRAALRVIADGSMFLPLPPGDIPNRPTPDLVTQRKIMGQTADYVENLAHVLPNLFAARVTLSFRNLQREVMASPRKGMIAAWQPMRLVSRTNTTVTYRDGEEINDGPPAKRLRPNHNQPLVTNGEFGPMLALVLFDAGYGQVRWSHWEQRSSGLEAVFAYSVPLPHSHYQPSYCCVHGKQLKQTAAYHGEIAVDPASGVVQRLTLQTDLSPDSPLFWTGIMVRYGPVDLGGRTYVCPLRTVSISQAKPQTSASFLKAKPIVYTVQPDFDLYAGPLQTLLNDTVFESYHLFRATVHILPSR